VTYVCFSAGGGRDRCFDILLLKQEKIGQQGVDFVKIEEMSRSVSCKLHPRLEIWRTSDAYPIIVQGVQDSKPLCGGPCQRPH
jgi:hypothetical protein